MRAGATGAGVTNRASPAASPGLGTLRPMRAPADNVIRLGAKVAAVGDLAGLVPDEPLRMALRDGQRAVPAIAKSPRLAAAIEAAARAVASEHRLYLDDSRRMEAIDDRSVDLIVTSPPYWTLKKYLPNEAQLGDIEDYDEFLGELDQVWAHALRVLVPGGRLVVVVGDVCLSRRKYGRHVVFPLHASIQEHCRGLGFDNLAPIIWYKIANAAHEVENGSAGFLGKPYEPGGVVKNDIEFVLFQRKPGGYRSPSLAARVLSTIAEDRHRVWFQQVWTGLGGASTRNHPAPFPLPLAERLVRMFSFVGDTVLDPFMGTGTTNVAAALWGRNSIGFEVQAEYFDQARRRLHEIEPATLVDEPPASAAS